MAQLGGFPSPFGLPQSRVAMTSLNPLLADTDLPDFAAIEAAHVVPAIEEAIDQHRAAIEQITVSQADDFGSVILAAERADFHLSRTWSPIGHLAGVADTPELREAHAAAQALMTAYLMVLLRELL